MAAHSTALSRGTERPRYAPAGLWCAPRTGRQHQIRAHLFHAGTPILGDKIYGPDELIFDRFTRRAMTDADHAALRLPRQALHAWKLELPHPISGAPLRLEAPLPEELREVLSKANLRPPEGTQSGHTGSRRDAGPHDER